MHQPGSRVRPIFWDIVLKVLNAFVLVSPHTWHPWPRPGIGFGNVLCQVDKICPPLPLAERHAGMSKAERRVLGRVCKIHSQAARLGSLCPSTVSQATSSHCAAQLPSLPARAMPSASVSGSQVAWLCLVTRVGRLPEGGTSCEGSGRSREGLIWLSIQDRQTHRIQRPGWHKAKWPMTYQTCAYQVLGDCTY